MKSRADIIAFMRDKHKKNELSIPMLRDMVKQGYITERELKQITDKSNSRNEQE